jgi:hypothetical protein
LAGAEAHIKPLLVDIIDHTLNVARDNPRVWRDLTQCAQSCVERRDFIRATIVSVLADQFKKGDLERKIVVRDAVQPPPGRFGRPEDGLPTELSKQLREELRSFVTERIEQSAFFAARAWEWYGIINRSLIAKHGIVTYFETSLGGIGGIDGICAIALSASKEFHEHFPGIVSRRKATDALAAIGSVGFSTAPFAKQSFSRSNGGPPLEIWDRLLKSFADQPAAMAGCLFAMMLSTGLSNQELVEEKVTVRGARQIFSQRDMIKMALANEGLRNLKGFSQIAVAAEAGTVLQ